MSPMTLGNWALRLVRCAGEYTKTIAHTTKPGDCDGDGIPNDQDGNNSTETVCTTTKIIWPNDDIAVGNKASINWKLLPEGCSLTDAQGGAVKAFATSGNIKSASAEKSAASLNTTIRIPCDPKLPEGPRAVAYDFSELGAALETRSADIRTPSHTQTLKMFWSDS